MGLILSTVSNADYTKYTRHDSIPDFKFLKTSGNIIHILFTHNT